MIRSNTDSRLNQLGVALCFLSAVAIAFSGCSKKETPLKSGVATLTGNEKTISDLITTEDLVLDLTPRLTRLAKWFQENPNSLADDLKTCDAIHPLADADAESIFQNDAHHPEFVTVAHWPVATTPTTEPVDPWKAIDPLEVQWETLKFGVVESHFLNAEQTEFSLHTKVEARGKRSAAVFGLKGHQELVFEQSDLSLIHI